MTLKRSVNTKNYFLFIGVRIKNLIPNTLQLLFYSLSRRVVNHTTKQLLIPLIYIHGGSTSTFCLRAAQNRW